MDIASALAADLHDVTVGLHVDPHRADATVSMLAHNLRLAVRSYQGLELSTYVSDLPVTVTAFEPIVQLDDIATSLRLPLDTVLCTDPRSQLVVYAGRPGAFVDLASDLEYALRLTPDLVVLDDHREPTTLRSGISGLTDLTTVNRAIGVLLGAGQSLASAHFSLRRRAEDLKLSLPVAAAAIVDEAVPRGGRTTRRG